MVEGIVFYALYKSKMLIIPRKADDSATDYSYPILMLIFSLFCGVTLRKHYIIKATWSVIEKKNAFSVRTVLKKYLFFGYKKVLTAHLKQFFNNIYAHLECYRIEASNWTKQYCRGNTISLSIRGKRHSRWILR